MEINATIVAMFVIYLFIMMAIGMRTSPQPNNSAVPSATPVIHETILFHHQNRAPTMAKNSMSRQAKGDVMR